MEVVTGPEGRSCIGLWWMFSNKELQEREMILKMNHIIDISAGNWTCRSIIPSSGSSTNSQVN